MGSTTAEQKVPIFCDNGSSPYIFFSEGNSNGGNHLGAEAVCEALGNLITQGFINERALTQQQVKSWISLRKRQNKPRPEWIISGDPSCIWNVQAFLQQQGSSSNQASDHLPEHASQLSDDVPNHPSQAGHDLTNSSNQESDTPTVAINQIRTDNQQDKETFSKGIIWETYKPSQSR